MGRRLSTLPQIHRRNLYFTCSLVEMVASSITIIVPEAQENTRVGIWHSYAITRPSLVRQLDEQLSSREANAVFNAISALNVEPPPRQS